MNRRFRVLPVLIAASALSACGARERVVSVPVPIACPRPDTQLPDQPGPISHFLTGNAEQDIGIVSGALIRERAYSTGLRSIIDACSARP